MRRETLALLFALLLVVALIFLIGGIGKPTLPRPSSTAVLRPEGKAGNPKLYPNPILTPGATDPSVMQGNIDETICFPGYSTSVRPRSSAMRIAKRRILKNYGIELEESSQFELDHLIPLELGGCPDCENNLWPEPYAPSPGAHQKDLVENYLHKEVCTGKMPLKEAQTAIANDWYRVYLQIQP